MTRRELLPALLAALAASPALRFWWRAARASGAAGEAWSDLGPVGRLPEGWQRRKVRLERRDRWRRDTREEAIYVRREGEAFQVVSAVCPHTGCLVRREGDGFACPCHKSRFDSLGRSVEGPSPRPLDALACKVERGRLLVRYVRFRPGRPRPEPLDA